MNFSGSNSQQSHFSVLTAVQTLYILGLYITDIVYIVLISTFISFAFFVFTIFGNGSVLHACHCAVLSFLQGSLKNERDYESVVMMRMRQAAERQRLIEQMQMEDEEEAAK